MEGVSEPIQLGKDNSSVYDLLERRELTRAKLACEKARYPGQRGLQAVQDLDILGMKNFFFLHTLLRVLRQGISGSISLALTIINSEVITREFLSLAALSGAQTLCFYESTEVVVVGEYEHLILRPLQVVPPSLESLNTSQKFTVMSLISDLHQDHFSRKASH